MFPGPVVPSELVYDRHPRLKEFLARQVDMQVADLRLLMRLPLDEVAPGVGCNLTTAAMIMNLVSGFSVWLYETERAAEIRVAEVAGRRQSRARFKGFVTEYWPNLAPEPFSAESVAERLYQVRNSLAHDLGAYDDPRSTHPREVRLAKDPMSAEHIVLSLKRNLVHPLKVPVIEERDDTYTVHLTGLYWAMHWMLRNGLDDRSDQIESRIETLNFPAVREIVD